MMFEKPGNPLKQKEFIFIWSNITIIINKYMIFTIITIKVKCTLKQKELENLVLKVG